MNSRLLLLPFFIIKLLTVNVPFLIGIILYPIHQYKTSIFVTFLFLLYSLFLLNSLQKTLSTPKISPKKFTLSTSVYETKIYQNPTEIDKIKTSLEKLNFLSPTTRNISLNLALISFYQDNSESFSQSWQQAKTADPNSPLFLVSPL